MITCIILSAGKSSRFGSPKALAKLSQCTVLEHLQKQLIHCAQVTEIIIVVGAKADQIKSFILNHNKVKVVYNKDYNFGQTSSFKAGLKYAAPDTQGFMLWPVDYPIIKNETIDQLINAFLENKSSILIPSFDGQKGHPPIFSASLKNEFLRLDNAVGLNMVARSYPEYISILPVDDMGVIMSFNSEEEFEKIKERKLLKDDDSG